MFCPNCGKEVQSDSNFCPRCGKNLKKVKVVINNDITEDQEQNNTSSNDQTIVFKPLNINGIDSTKEISNIIKQVDNKISENINKYATSSHNKAEIENALQNNKNINDIKDLKKDNDNDHTEKKFNVKTWWKNFINEGEDEFSIFASIDESKENNNDKIELSSSSTSIDTLSGISNDTLSIPKETIEAKLDEINLDDGLKIKEKISEIEDKAKDKKQDLFEKYKIDKKNKIKILNEENIKTKEEKVNIKKTKLKEPAEKLSHKSFTEQVNEELRKLQENQNKKSEKSNSTDTVIIDPTVLIDNNPSTKEENIKTKKKQIINNSKNKNIKSLKNKILNNENQKKEKSDNNTFKDFFKNELKSKKERNDKINDFMNLILNKLNNFDTLTKSNGKKSLYTFFAIGVVLAFLPILISEKTISFSVIMLLIFKLLFAFLEFYVSLKIVTEKVFLESSPEEVKHFAFQNWFICQVFLFITYILSPWDGLFNFSLLPALTPLPVAMILLFAIAITISLAQYWKQLNSENLINFVGWYLIPFILIHFTSKIFFLFINIIF